MAARGALRGRHITARPTSDTTGQYHRVRPPRVRAAADGQARARTAAAGSRLRAGPGALVVTTKQSAEHILEEYAELIGNLAELPLGIVDCVTGQQGPGDVNDDRRVTYAPSPVDLTGIGVEFSAFLEAFHERGLRRNSVLRVEAGEDGGEPVTRLEGLQASPFGRGDPT